LRDAEEFVGAPRTKKRGCKQHDRYHALVAQVAEPSSFPEAAQHHVWVKAMVEEHSAIMTNDVWEVVLRPKDKSVVGSRWIYKIKYATNESVEKYKARFVAKGTPYWNLSETQTTLIWSLHHYQGCGRQCI